MKETGMNTSSLAELIQVNGAGYPEPVRKAALVELAKGGIHPPAYESAVDDAIRCRNDALLVLLIQAGASVPPESLGRVIAGGLAKTVQALMDSAHLSVNAFDAAGCAPLHLAVEHNQVEIVRLLLNNEKIQVNVQDADGSTPLLRAAARGHAACMRELLNYAPVNGQKLDVNLMNKRHRTPLMVAVLNNRLPCVHLLLSAEGVEVNCKSVNQRTPLSVAAGQGLLPCIHALLSSEKVDVNTRDRYGMTPLMHAQEREHWKCVRLLRLYTRNAPCTPVEKDGGVKKKTLCCALVVALALICGMVGYLVKDCMM